MRLRRPRRTLLLVSYAKNLNGILFLKGAQISYLRRLKYEVVGNCRTILAHFRNSLYGKYCSCSTKIDEHLKYPNSIFQIYCNVQKPAPSTVHLKEKSVKLTCSLVNFLLMFLILNFIVITISYCNCQCFFMTFKYTQFVGVLSGSYPSSNKFLIAKSKSNIQYVYFYVQKHLMDVYDFWKECSLQEFGLIKMKQKRGNIPGVSSSIIII